MPKTIIGNCAYKWIGMQERQKDAYYLAEETGIPVDKILDLTKLHYIYKNQVAEITMRWVLYGLDNVTCITKISARCLKVSGIFLIDRKPYPVGMLCASKQYIKRYRNAN